MEDKFGLVLVIIVDYATGLLLFKYKRYFRTAPVLEGDLGGVHRLNAMEGAVKLCD